MYNVKEQVEAHRFINNLTGKSKFRVSKNSLKLGLSRQTYQNKLDLLREKKIIANFTININPDIQPNNLKYVMIEIKTNPKEPKLVKELLKIPQLRMLDGIIGEFSLFGLLIFRSPEEYYHTLNRIDNIMAESHFKKYQIIETIKVFKKNGISLKETKMTNKEKLFQELDNGEFKVEEKFDLEEIAKNLTDIDIGYFTYNPKRFPGILIKVKDTNISIIVESNGMVYFRGLKKEKDLKVVFDKIFKILTKIGVDLDKKPDFEIDEVDFNILNILRDNQGFKPISTYEIRNFFHEQLKKDISQSTIHNRIKRLEEKGVILNYTVNFHPKKIGFTGKYLLRVKPQNPSHYDELALKLEKIAQITDLFRIGEQFGLFAIVRVKKIEDYAQFIRGLYEEEIEDTYTNFVLDELIPYTNFIF
jgi:Lrp/AsnC family leucine-responsive transcriptional regulator